MQIFTYGKMQIVCEWENTRSGFRHIAVLLVRGIERDRTKVCYLNRTWEHFQFQTVMLKLIDKTTALTNREKAGFKKKINYGR